MAASTTRAARRWTAGVITVLAATPAAAGAAGHLVAPPSDPDALAPTAVLEWRMPDRFDDGWDAWRRTAGTYRASYVSPSSWTVEIDGCRSSGRGSRIVRYEVAVAGIGHDFFRSSAGSSCRQRVRGLPRLGEYDIGLAVHTERGGVARTAERVTLRDWLVVSLGDSMASGEGSPDRSGLYRLRTDLSSTKAKLRFLGLLTLGHPRPDANTDLDVRQSRPVRWKDKRCHRSARAGHARAARSLERRDPHSSVTFVSLACSGAKVAHLLDTPYTGQQPPVDPRPKRLRPQLAVLRDLVRPRGPGQTRRAGRRIDALLLSIGINDVGFSTIVEKCARNPASPKYGDPSCVTGTRVDRKIDDLEDKYRRLDRALRGFDIDEVYLTDYPAAPFGRGDRSGGCGILGLRLVGIKRDEANRMYSAGRHLNATVRAAANRHGWNFVDGMTDRFLGRDYCRHHKRRNFVRLEESLRKQGTEHGTSHPNPRGHAALGSLLTRAIGLDLPDHPFVRARLVIDEVRLGRSVRDQLDDVDITFHPSQQKEVTVRRGVQYMGRWRPLGLELVTDVHDPPRPPRYATGIRVELRPHNASTHVVRIRHDRRDGWGVGVHEAASAPTSSYPDGFLGVRYRIVAERVLGPPAPGADPILTPVP